MRPTALSSNTFTISLIAISIAIQFLWLNYTHYTEEDAFITFRYAEQIARGNGFVYNIGEPIYGTTTPLYTLLLAFWLKFISTNILLGANTINLLAASAIPLVTWKTLKLLQRSNAEQTFTLIALMLSSKLIYMNTQGMEISLSIFLLASSWYAWIKDKPIWTGLLCGLLLWARIDTVFWLMILILVTMVENRKNAIIIGAIAAITYLPWIVYAAAYFGSPIPYTVTAKWVAYSLFDQTPYINHLGTVLRYLSPFREQINLQWLGTLLIMGVASWGIWKNRLFRDRSFYILIIFVLFEISRLTLTRATFFNRYFIPILWASLILFGMGLGTLWDKLKTNPTTRKIFLSLVILWAIAQIISGILFARSVRERQFFRHESSLKAMGLWLKSNTSPESTVLLEPLGYVGYYSDRIMIDEVGLVTPAVTELKRQRINANEYASVFQPDYFVAHCGETVRLQSVPEQTYRLIKTFNPLNFEAGALYSSDLPRSSCYQIWKKN